MGMQHACAIMSNGELYCWGRSREGQTARVDGQHGKLNVNSMVNVNLGTGRSAVSISCGMLHTCAVLDDGGVKCWGRNNHGQLGYDSTDSKGDAPDEMASLGAVNLGASAIAIAAGHEHKPELVAGREPRVFHRGKLALPKD